MFVRHSRITKSITGEDSFLIMKGSNNMGQFFELLALFRYVVQSGADSARKFRGGRFQ